MAGFSLQCSFVFGVYVWYIVKLAGQTGIRTLFFVGGGLHLTLEGSPLRCFQRYGWPSCSHSLSNLGVPPPLERGFCVWKAGLGSRACLSSSQGRSYLRHIPKAFPKARSHREILFTSWAFPAWLPSKYNQQHRRTEWERLRVLKARCPLSNSSCSWGQIKLLIAPPGQVGFRILRTSMVPVNQARPCCPQHWQAAGSESLAGSCLLHLPLATLSLPISTLQPPLLSLLCPEYAPLSISQNWGFDLKAWLKSSFSRKMSPTHHRWICPIWCLLWPYTALLQSWPASYPNKSLSTSGFRLFLCTVGRIYCTGQFWGLTALAPSKQSSCSESKWTPDSALIRGGHCSGNFWFDNKFPELFGEKIPLKQRKFVQPIYCWFCGLQKHKENNKLEARIRVKLGHSCLVWTWSKKNLDFSTKSL